VVLIQAGLAFKEDAVLRYRLEWNSAAWRQRQ
jgi:hypothetical protein